MRLPFAIRAGTVSARGYWGTLCTHRESLTPLFCFAWQLAAVHRELKEIDARKEQLLLQLAVLEMQGGK